MLANRKLMGVGLLLPILVFFITFGVMAARPLANPPTAKAIGLPGLPNPCDLLPGGVATDICKGATDPVGTAIGAIPGIPNPTELIASAGNVLVKTFLEQLVGAEADAVAAILRSELEFINSSTTPDVTASWFATQYELVFGMAVIIALFGFFLRGGLGVKDQDPGEIAKGGFALVVFLVGGMFLPVIVAGLVHVFDGVMAPEWMNVAGASANKSIDGLSDTLVKTFVSPGNIVVPIFMPLIILFFGAIAGVIVEIILYFREGLIYLLTAAEVAALAMFVGGRWTIQAFKRTTLALVGLIPLKLIMAIIFTFGTLLIGNANKAADSAILGTVMLLLLPVATLWAYRVISQHNVQLKLSDKLNTAFKAVKGFVK